MSDFDINETDALAKIESVTGQPKTAEIKTAQEFVDTSQKEDQITQREAARKELLKELIPTIEEEIKNRSTSLTVSQWNNEKAVMQGEIAKLKQELDTFKQLLLRAKAQGKANIPPENQGENNDLRAIYGGIFDFLK